MLYKGSNKIGQVYKGNTKIGQIYKGNTLIWSSDPYDIDEIVFESSTAGTYPVNIAGDGLYEVYCIGGGGGVAVDMYTMLTKRRFCSAGGGSGSGFIGILQISSNNYTIIVGSGGSSGMREWGSAGTNSSISNIITSYAGNGGRANPSSLHSGTGGAIPNIYVPIISYTLNTTGKSGGTSFNGTSTTGGASVYNGYGAGSGNISYSGTSGYVKIVYKGQG